MLEIMQGTSSSGGIAAADTQQQHCCCCLMQVDGETHLMQQHRHAYFSTPCLQQNSASMQHMVELPMQPRLPSPHKIPSYIQQQASQILTCPWSRASPSPGIATQGFGARGGGAGQDL